MLSNLGESSTNAVSVAGSRLRDRGWGKSLNGKDSLLTRGDDDGDGTLGSGKGKRQSKEPIVLDPNMDLHPLVEKDTLFSLADLAPIFAENSVYENTVGANADYIRLRISIRALSSFRRKKSLEKTDGNQMV